MKRVHRSMHSLFLSIRLYTSKNFVTFAVMEWYRNIKKQLTDSGIEDGEASAIAFMLLEEIGKLGKTDVMMGREPENEAMLLAATQRVAEGEPVQYVLGKAEFCGLSLHVEPGVLIPRAETEELINSISPALSLYEAQKGMLRIADIGTGSGCIAIALANRFPNASVSAIDISEQALSIAKKNAESFGAGISFMRKDILAECLEGEYDLVISNPPYICNCEAEDMEKNVLEHEPHLALFVPDNDPLLFYRRIAEQGLEALTNGGMLAYEINRRFGKETVAMLKELGYTDIELNTDQFGNDRFVKAIKP